MKIGYSGALWSTVLDVKMSARKSLKINLLYLSARGNVAPPLPFSTPLLNSR